MLSVDVLRSKPLLFRSLTGWTVEAFEEPLARFLPVGPPQRRERRSRPDRRRAIGGGRKYRLSLPKMWRMTLLWLRQYGNLEALAFFFGVDKATVSRNTRQVWNALQLLGLASLGWPQPPRQGEGKSLQEALETFPDGRAIIDGTEPRIQRPQDPEAQRPHSSGGRKTHPRQTLLAVDHPGYIRGASFSAPGSQHDLRLAVESGMIRQIPESMMGIGDAGFDGLQNDDPDRSIRTPHKARRNHPLLPDPKRAPPERASMRMVVEHTIGWWKRFRILSSVFRHMLALYDTVFLAVVGIGNFRMDRRGRKAESVAGSALPPQRVERPLCSRLEREENPQIPIGLSSH